MRLHLASPCIALCSCVSPAGSSCFLVFALPPRVYSPRIFGCAALREWLLADGTHVRQMLTARRGQRCDRERARERDRESARARVHAHAHIRAHMHTAGLLCGWTGWRRAPLCSSGAGMASSECLPAQGSGPRANPAPAPLHHSLTTLDNSEVAAASSGRRMHVSMAAWHEGVCGCAHGHPQPKMAQHYTHGNGDRVFHELVYVCE